MRNGRSSLVVMTIMMAVMFTVSCFGVQWLKIELGYSREYGDLLAEYGLWKACNTSPFVNICNNYIYSKIPGLLWGVRILSIATILSSFSAVIMAALTFYIEKIPARHICILLITGGACGILALAIFASKYEEIFPTAPYQFGWSIILEGATSVLSIVLAIFYIVCVEHRNPTSQTPLSRFV